MRKKITAICLSLSLMFTGAISAFAGGALESVDITAGTPSPIAGHTIARVIGIKWDARAVPVRYSMNTSLGPNIPNPLTPFTPVLTLAQAQAALQGSFNRWNDIPTSFINMQITGTTAKTTVAGFDFINEVTFRTAAAFAAIASSPSVNLITDVTLVHGDLIDGDADPDVSNLITTVQDADGDGDLEFPAGFYKAGTILDNDVQFNTKVSNGFRFTTGDAALDIVTRSVDLDCVATHEFGHSHGLSHTLDNQYSSSDGNGTTMFPFIDTGDPASEASQRTLESDDVAWSSYFYQEGTAASGPAALQPGDSAFDKVYGLITGELRHGVLDQPIAGGSLSAYDRQNDRFVSASFSGTTQISRSPTGGLFLISPAFNIIDGKYTIPVPKGSYEVVIEPVDGAPVTAASVSLTTQIGSAFGQHNFSEEFYNNNKEGDLELRPGQGKNIAVNPGKTKADNDVVTNRTLNVNNFGNRNFVGFTNQPAGSYYVVQIPAAQIAAINPGQDILVHSGAFDVNVSDASVLPFFTEAMLATGTINPDTTASIDLANPLAHSVGFIGQDDDFSPFYFKNPHVLGQTVRNGIASGEITNLFLVLRLPTATPFPGISNRPPLIGLDGSGSATGLPNDAPMFGFSYVSTNGVTFNRVNNFNFRFSLVLSEPAN